VIIGGGLGCRLGEPYVKRIRGAMAPHLFKDDHPPALHVAVLGDLGGAIGAALVCATKDKAPRVGARRHAARRAKAGAARDRTRARSGR
jgi:glucokinase